MIQYLEAITLLKNQAKPLSTETVAGQAMLGRVAAECVTSSMLSPPFHTVENRVGRKAKDNEIAQERLHVATTFVIVNLQ